MPTLTSPDSNTLSWGGSQISSVREMSVQPDDAGRLSLAYREIRELPHGVAEKYGKQVKELDLSHNQFTYPS